MLQNGTVAKSRFPQKHAESRSAQVDNLQWQIFHLDVTFVGVLPEHCQPKHFLFMKLSGVTHSVYRPLWMRVKRLSHLAF